MKCKNDVLMAKVGQKKLNKQVEVDFSVQKKLPDCRRINAKNFVLSDAASPTYNMYQIPTNQFECFEFGCVNSGTLINDGDATIYVADNGSDWASGVITFYVMSSSATSATVKISADTTMANANSYNVDLSNFVVGGGGYKAVVVDLSKTPTQIGTGYVPSNAPAYISIELTGASAGDGISSIGILDEMEDFATETHVKVGCVTGIDGTFDLELAEETCFNSDGYNVENVTSIERTITGNAVTSNYFKLNPFYKKGISTVGFDIETVQKTIEAAGSDFGSIKLYNMNTAECGFVSAQIPMCTVGDGMLTRISIKSLVDLDDRHFLLIDAGDYVEVMFNKSLIGQSVVVSYPKLVDAEAFIINADDANDNRIRMTYVRKYTDGYKYRFVFDNVYVTSFPDSITEDDEYSFSFTISIKKDEYGNFGYAYRIIE